MQVIWGALRIGDETLARDALKRRAAVTRDKYSRFLRLATESRFRPWLARPLLALTLWSADDAFVADAAELARVGLEVDAPEAQLEIGRLLASSKHLATDHRRAGGFAAEATALLLLGRPLEALRQLDSGAAITRPGSGYRLQPWEWRVLLPIAGVPGIPEAAVDTGRRELEAIAAKDQRWPRATWALFLDANARGDVALRDRLRTALGARPQGTRCRDMLHSSPMPSRLEPTASSTARWPSPVRFIWSRVTRWRRGGDHSCGPWCISTARQWQLGRDYLKADREWLWHENNDFRGWPDGEPQEGELDAALSAVVRLKRARDFVRQDGQPKATACPLFRRVSQLWHNAEPSFDSLRGEIQREIDQCRD